MKKGLKQKSRAAKIVGIVATALLVELVLWFCSVLVVGANDSEILNFENADAAKEYVPDDFLPYLNNLYCDECGEPMTINVSYYSEGGLGSDYTCVLIEKWRNNPIISWNCANCEKTGTFGRWSDEKLTANYQGGLKQTDYNNTKIYYFENYRAGDNGEKVLVIVSPFAKLDGEYYVSLNSVMRNINYNSELMTLTNEQFLKYALENSKSTADWYLNNKQKNS